MKDREKLESGAHPIDGTEALLDRIKELEHHGALATGRVHELTRERDALEAKLARAIVGLREACLEENHRKVQPWEIMKEIGE